MFEHYVNEYDNLQLILDLYTPHPQCKWDPIHIIGTCAPEISY